MIETTLAIIKPDAMWNRHAGDVLGEAERDGFAIAEARVEHPTRDTWKEFYAEHAERPFFEALTEFMASGPVLVLVLEREDAIARWRHLLGATDSRQARPGSLRALWGDKTGEAIWRNVAHGSDSREAVLREVNFFYWSRSRS